MADTDFNQLFSSTTPGAQIIYATASSTVNLFGATIPLWLGLVGIIAGLFVATLLAVGIWVGVMSAIGK